MGEERGRERAVKNLGNRHREGTDSKRQLFSMTKRCCFVTLTRTAAKLSCKGSCQQMRSCQALQQNLINFKRKKGGREEEPPFYADSESQPTCSGMWSEQRIEIVPCLDSVALSRDRLLTCYYEVAYKLFDPHFSQGLMSAGPYSFTLR